MARKKTLAWLGAATLGLVLVTVGGTWLYLNVVRDDPPPPLVVQAGSPSSTATVKPATGTEGVWQVSAGSQAGYRVQEVLFGQRATAVGRTTAVTGSFTVAGTSVTGGSFRVDLTSVTSDESRRDRQFAGRIMAVDRFPTATFELTEPIALPATAGPNAAKATGNLTLRGTTKKVTIPLTVDVDASGTKAQVAGTFPVVFAEWGIPNPTAGPAQTEDNGVLEFLLVVSRTP